MAQELINKIKEHPWTKPQLEEIMDFCAYTLINEDYITEK